MTLVEYILAKLAEEAAEVGVEAALLTKAAMKSQRFGLASHHPITGQSNVSLLLKAMWNLESEYQDVRFTMMLLAFLTGDFKEVWDPVLQIGEDDRYPFRQRWQKLAPYLEAAVKEKILTKKDIEVLNRLADKEGWNEQ